MKRCSYLLTALLSLFLLWSQTAASAAPLASPKTVSGPNYAGYSWHPTKGFVVWATSLWNVPKIDCDKAPNGNDARHARVAVWVGIWGGPNTNKALKNAWLPQVGTISNCQISKSVTPSYTAVAQMEHFGGCNVPGDAGCMPQTLSLQVRPEDLMNSQIAYEGAGTGIHAGEYKFAYVIIDERTGKSSSGVLYTAHAVLRSDVAYQGGAIVEDQDGYGNSLALFPTPIAIIAEAGGSDKETYTTSPTYLWNMVVSGNQLARTGPFKNHIFTVTWKHWD
jgi:hypothetical protein